MTNKVDGVSLYHQKRESESHTKFKTMNLDTTSLEFKLAYEMIVLDFCAICQKQGLSSEQTKAEMIANADSIAERIKFVLSK